MAAETSDITEHKLSFSARLFASLIGYPKSCLIFALLVTALAIAGYYRPDWPQEMWDAFQTKEASKETELNQGSKGAGSNSSSGQRRRLRSSRVASTTLGNADAFLVVQSKQFFTREGAAAIRHVIERLEALDTVANVTWMDNAPPLNIFGLAEPILPRGNASPQRFEVARKKALQHPLVVGMFLSPDTETLLLTINFDWVFVQEDADCDARLLETAQTALSDFPNVDMTFAVTGPVPLRLMLIKNQESNKLKFQIIGYGMILLMAAILFRGLSVVFVVAAAPTIGVFWTLGLIRYFGLENNPFSDVILPVLLSLVGFTDSVHMMVYIRRCLHQGMNPLEACRQALAAVGLACFLTSLTTAIGMGALILAKHEIVREFGMACVIGVFATWLSVMLVVPLACTTSWSNRLARGTERGWIDRNLYRFARGVGFFLKRPKLTSYTSIAVTLILSAVALTLRPDDRKSNLLPTGSSAQKALAHLDQSMGGLDVCSVNIRWENQETTPEEVAGIVTEIDRVLDSEPLLGHPLSVCRLLAALPGEGAPAEKMSMVDLFPPPLKLAVYDPDEQQAKVTFRVQDLGTAAYKPTFERIENAFQQIASAHPGLEITLSGEPIWRWHDLYQVVTDLTSSLGTASFVILLVFAISFRSIRIGLIAIVPNLLPLAMAATWLVVTGQALDIVSVCAFTVCLSIAVDDTIHFIARYRDEQHTPGESRLVVIERAFQGVGTALIMTTIVLVAGFSSVLISETRDHRVFASLAIVTLTSALFCDLFLLPALLAYFDRSGGEPRNTQKTRKKEV